jgi:hypothetical protein
MPIAVSHHCRWHPRVIQQPPDHRFHDLDPGVLRRPHVSWRTVGADKAFATVFREILSRAAIDLIDSPSGRCNRRMSAQSSTVITHPIVWNRWLRCCNDRWTPSPRIGEVFDRPDTAFSRARADIWSIIGVQLTGVSGGERRFLEQIRNAHLVEGHGHADARGRIAVSRESCVEIAMPVLGGLCSDVGGKFVECHAPSSCTGRVGGDSYVG